MKKIIGILALVLAIVMSFFTITAFATGEENGNSQMPFVDSDQIMPEHPDIQTEADMIEEFEEMFGEGSGKILSIAMVGIVVSMLFFPALIVVIVFGVLNSKTKKKVKEYEKFFGYMPKNAPAYYNQNMNNSCYGIPPLNPTGAPMGSAPTGNYYNPQNDINNQKGGQL